MIKKRSKKKSFLALLCSLLLVFTSLPLTVAADSSVSTNGNHVLKVQTTDGKQYDGAQIGTSVTNLVYGSTYTFSFDLYTPDQDVDGIILQSNGSYTWIKDTGALTAASPAWTTYTGDFAFTNPSDVGKQIQFVKKGGATDTKNITYYIDNFVVKDKASSTVVLTEDFEDNTVGDFTQSGTATLSAAAPPVTNYFLKVQTTDGKQYDGAQIGTSVTNLVYGSTYTFSFDLYTPDQDVDGIILQSNGSYTWIKDTGALTAASPAWTTYTGDFAFTNPSDVGKQIQFVKKGGATDTKNITYYIDNFVVKDKASSTVVLTEDFEDKTVGDFTQSGTATLTTVNSITGSTPPTTDPPPTSDKVVVAYNLQWDTDLANLVSMGGSSYLQKAGPTINAVSNTDGTVSLDQSNRTDSWHGVDVRASAIGLKANSAYTVELTGHIPDGVTIPSGAKIVLGGSGDPWTALSSVDAASTFTLSYSGTAAAGTGETTGLRIQADAGLSRFVIDTLVVKVKGGTEMPPKSMSNVPGVHVSLSSNGDSWSGANIILGTDSAVWPFSTGDGVAFTPVKDAKYHLTFSATSTGTTGYRIRWITGNENGGYTAADTAITGKDSSYDYAAGTVATTIPASFTSGVTNSERLDYAIDFTMGGNELAQGLIGNIAIRGIAGSGDFLLHSIKITDDDDNVLVNWTGSSSVFVPDDYVWPEAAWNLTLPSLKDAYSKYFTIGNIMEPGQTTDAALTAMYKQQYNVVTPENSMKPDNLLRNMSSASDLSDPSKYNFDGSDQIVKWAEDNNQSIHGHTLVWHSQTPAFINTGASGTRAAARANMETFIHQVTKHFDSPNQISWDVANEVFDDNTANFNGSDWRTGLRTGSPWYTAYASGADTSKGESGADYIYDAFVFTHLAQAEIGSTATLYYNDYNETYKYEQIAQMVESLNAQWEQDSRYDGRKLIEGIGMQSHFWINSKPDVNVQEVERAIERFVATGTRISISELDIPYAANNNYHLDDAKQAYQAEMYGILFGIYKKYVASIDRVTFWGKADIHSWRGSGMPLLFDNSFRPKTAFYTVLGLVKETSTDSPSTDSPSTGTTPPADPNPAKPGEVKAVVDANGNAKSQVKSEDVKKALSEAKAGTMKLQLQDVENAKQISVSLPVDLVNVAKEAGVKRIEISTGLASVQLPVSLFAGVADNAIVELTIDKVDNSKLSKEQQALVGSSTVIDFNLIVDGQKITDFGQGQKVKVAFPYTLKPGENPGQIVIYYLSDDGKLEVVKNGRFNKETGMVEFGTNHFSKYAAITNPITFKDVKAVAWARESIEGMAARGIVGGVGNDSFAPGNFVTRAEFLQMLMLMLDLNQANATSSFSDVKQGTWYYNAVASAQQLGIVSGLTDGSFGINNKITRQEMAAMAYHAIQKAGITLNEEQTEALRDTQDVASYAKEAVTAMHQAGIINGVGNGNFNPKGTAIRAEAAVILYQLLMKSL